MRRGEQEKRRGVVVDVIAEEIGVRRKRGRK